MSSSNPAPVCPNGHGPLVRREHLTRDAAWCGDWLDCPPGPPGDTCRSSVLIPSQELLAQYRSLGWALDTKGHPHA